MVRCPAGCNIEANVSQPKGKTLSVWRGSVLGGLFGVVVGFLVGFLPFAALVPFASGEERKWLPGIAVLVGVGSAFVGGILGIISGTLVGAQAAVRAFVTRGLFFGLIGVVAGFIVCFFVYGLTEETHSGAVVGGILGIISGTMVGTWQVARKQR
jgi:hypothetical protein